MEVQIVSDAHSIMANLTHVNAVQTFALPLADSALIITDLKQRSDQVGNVVLYTVPTSVCHKLSQDSSSGEISNLPNTIRAQLISIAATSFAETIEHTNGGSFQFRR
jgi:hypothetical protein